MGHLEIGPLHKNLEKGCSEPSWEGYSEENRDLGLNKCQEDFLGIPERLEIQVCREAGYFPGNDYPKERVARPAPGRSLFPSPLDLSIRIVVKSGRVVLCMHDYKL